jgi:hypothetical protein
MRRTAWPVLVCLVVALALLVTAAVLDAFLLNGQRVRVAFLPPWESGAGLLLTTFVGLALVAHRARSTSGPAHEAMPDVLWPALASAVLLLPFLPILPDVFPVLQILAGPLRWVVWLAIVALLVRTWWRHWPPASRWLPQSVLARTIVIGLISALVCATAAARLAGTVLYPAGDEPHYLVIAQSLWRDGDLKIENNHERGDYREYFRQPLEPHYLTRGSDGEIYSIHPVGLPVLLAPVYAAGGYPGVLIALIAMASCAAALAWRWVAVASGSALAATFAWAVVVLSAPYLFNTFTVYPEIAAGLAVVVGITTRRPLVLGIACGSLPWLSTKYAPMSAALFVTGLVAGSGSSTWRLLPARSLAQAIGAYGTLLAAWFAFFYLIWGNPLPQAPYGAMVQTTPWNLVFGAPGLLFDQEYGLLPYAPAYVLAATGLWVLWRSGGERRALAIRVVLVFGALLGTVGAFRIWWGGSASPSRPLASALLVLMLPIAAAFADASQSPARRAAQHLLLWLGIGAAFQMGFAQEGFLLANGRDGTASLLEWWSPNWEVWTLVPTFIHHEAGTALLQTLAWLTIAVACAVVLRRRPIQRPGAAALTACAVLAAGLVAVALAVPLLPADPPLPVANLLARPRIAALDSFDAAARPAALVYDPFRKAAATDQVSSFTLSVTPGLRPEPQPLRVVHNGRFSLPAGRYRADVRFIDGERIGPLPLSLQFGRTGSPVATWTVDPATGPWSTELWLPVDVGFVGFRSPRELERAISAITLTPLAVVDESRRPRVPQVLAAGQYGEALVLFHDDWTTPEPEGFWVHGRRPTQLTIAGHSGAAAAAPLAFRLRADYTTNHVRISAPGWIREFDLPPGEPQVLELPPASRGVVSLTIETTGGFVPSERNPSVRDTRLLGAWVDFK